MPRKWLWLAVLLPVFALAAAIVRAQLHLHQAQAWQFRITGYDPRDPLRGHYLMFRLDLDPQGSVADCSADGECCLCLKRSAAADTPQVSYQECSLARHQCDGLLRQRYVSQIQRFYIPEARAQEAEQRLAEAARQGGARIVVAVDASGKPQIRQLLVNGAPIVP